MDALVLARLQFASNISFHILFPTINIARAWFLLFVRWRHRRSGDDTWMAIYRLWVKIFALSFAMGVVSGIVMSFQFGTNWPGYMQKVGNIAGPLLAYEVLTAFFLEAGFLGIMLFGVGRVSPRVHTLATLLVATGTTLSAFWILALSSWMHTPAGFEMRDGVAHATDWFAIVFNPSFPYRFTHMLLASGLTVSFLIAGISAWRWLRGDTGADVRLSLRMASVLAAVLIPLQILAGDLHGLNTLQHQPAKIAAMEAIWEDERAAGLRLFAWPNEKTRSNDYSLAVPNLASLILTHSLDGQIRGLNSFSDAHPPVAPLFFGFRLMVGIGLAMLALSWSTLWLWRRRCGALPPWCLRAWVAMSFSGWLATRAGWYVTEIGRQPYLVYGVLKTSEAASSTPAPMIALSLAMYLSVYVLLLIAYVRVLYVLAARATMHVAKAEPTRSVVEVL